MLHFLIFDKENHINTIKPAVLSPWGFPSGSAVKNLPAVREPQETRVLSLGGEDPLEEGMATHSSILAWRIPMDRGAWWATVHSVAKNRHDRSNLAHKHMLSS